MPHPFTLPPSIIDRAMKRQGTAHPFARLDAAKTALVVIDLQNAFMAPAVAHVLCEAAPAIVPNVNRLAAAVRAAGGLVGWVGMKFTQETLATWSHFHADLLTPEASRLRIAALSEGSVGREFWPALAIAPHDIVAEKLKYSAFMPGSSDLPAQLRARGIDTVLIAGCVTNVCCESSGRDAMMLDFKTVMVSDANAAMTDEEHAASLIGFYLNFGDVLTTDEAIAGLRVGARAHSDATV